MYTATTGWGLIYFNLLNLFKIHNLHTSLPLSSRSARHPRSSCPFVICCTAQSTFLPIPPIPVLFPVFPAICVNSCGQNGENNLCQFSRDGPGGISVDSSRREPEGTGKRKPLTLPTIRVQSSLSDALTHRTTGGEPDFSGDSNVPIHFHQKG